MHKKAKDIGLVRSCTQLLLSTAPVCGFHHRACVGPIVVLWPLGRHGHSPLAPFLFLYFSKTFFIEIYFQYHILQFCTPTARQGGGRGPAAQQRGGRDLYVNLKKNYLRGSPWRELAAPLAGGRPPAANPLGGRGPAARQGGGSLPPRASAQINVFLFIYKSLQPGRRAAGPLPPPWRAVGVQNCKL